ncbi:MAG: hypothetical protein ACRC0L_12880 [Angustibacter sp.]
MNRLQTLAIRTVSLLALLGVLGVAGTGYVWAKTPSTGTRTAFNADSVAAGGAGLIRGGPVRLGREVYTHNYTNHASVGIRVVGLENGCTLTLDTSFVAGRDYIVAAIVDEDETVSRLGIQAGVRGGGELARVYLYKGGREICADDPRFGSVANLWISLIAVRSDKVAGAARR